MNYSSSFCRKQARAFTLIELLVVIAIIGILAALIVGGSAIAITKARRASVEAQRDTLITAIESYHNAKGFYPPDNTLATTTNSTYQNTLFYELTGMKYTPANTTFISPVSGESLTAMNLTSYFGAGGILNSSADTNNPPQNFYVGLKANQHEIVNVGGAGAGAGNSFTVLGINVSGPVNLAPTTAPGYLINPWNYVVSHPTNNVDSFDLWMDVAWAGKTNRVSNWSKDPQVVSY
jgi:prepilin-type N-terminal cleavage/methylation domain-containing protein